MSKKIKACKDCSFSKRSFLLGWDGAKCLHNYSIHAARDGVSFGKKDRLCR